MGVLLADSLDAIGELTGDILSTLAIMQNDNDEEATTGDAYWGGTAKTLNCVAGVLGILEALTDAWGFHRGWHNTCKGNSASEIEFYAMRPGTQTGKILS